MSDYHHSIKDEISTTLNFEELETDLKKLYSVEDLNKIENLGLEFYKRNTKTIEIYFKC